MRVLMTGGGTGGHVNPALAIAHTIMENEPDSEIAFVGTSHGIENKLVPAAGYHLYHVEVQGISRSLTPKNLKAIYLALTSPGKAKKIIREFRPDVVIGTGGYVCYPVLRAAHALGIPTLVHESNAVPGLTTKLLAATVDCVMVGFADAKANYPKKTNVVFTGTPVRGDFEKYDRASAKRELGITEDKPLLLSVWGSLGSDYMNGVMPEFMALTAGKQDFTMIYSAGKRGYEKLSAALKTRCGEDLSARGVDVRAYIYDMPTVMAAADLVMCRSGASTLGELAALGKPAILIPSPNVTNNHQEKNARLLENMGAAKVLLEGQFTPESLYQEAEALLRDAAMLQTMGSAMRSSGVPDATEKIADLVLNYIK